MTLTTADKDREEQSPLTHVLASGEYSILIEIDDEPLLATNLVVGE